MQNTSSQKAGTVRIHSTHYTTWNTIGQHLLSKWEQSKQESDAMKTKCLEPFKEHVIYKGIKMWRLDLAIQKSFYFIYFFNIFY